MKDFNDFFLIEGNIAVDVVRSARILIQVAYTAHTLLLADDMKTVLKNNMTSDEYAYAMGFIDENKSTILKRQQALKEAGAF